MRRSANQSGVPRPSVAPNYRRGARQPGIHSQGAAQPLPRRRCLWQAPPETGWEEHDRLVKTDCGPGGGTLYVVAGSASQTGKGRINHKAMRYSSKSKGTALLSIMGNSKARIDFVNEAGEVEDVVELHKQGKSCLA